MEKDRGNTETKLKHPCDSRKSDVLLLKHTDDESNDEESIECTKCEHKVEMAI